LRYFSETHSSTNKDTVWDSTWSKKIAEQLNTTTDLQVQGQKNSFIFTLLASAEKEGLSNAS
jgi:hypothetical protein